MDVCLMYFEGCPHAAVAEQRLRVALDEVGLDSQGVRHQLVETPEDAERLGFIGSPTILVNGRDPFATGSEPAALACRVYDTPEGRSGSPTVEQLVAALS